MQRLRGRGNAAAGSPIGGSLSFTEDEQEVAAAIIAADGLPPLLQLLRSGSPAVQEEAAHALNNCKAIMRTAPSAVVAAAQVSGLDSPAICRLLSGALEPVVISVAASVVAVIAQSSLSGHGLGAAGGVQLQLHDLLVAGVVHNLVALLSSTELIVQFAGLAPIAALASTPAGAAALLEAGGACLLVQVLSHDSIFIQRTACLTLHDMAVHSTENSRIIAASGAAAPMLALLSSASEGSGDSSSCSGDAFMGMSSSDTAKLAAGTLTNLCTASPAACEEVEAAGGVPLLERIARLPDQELQMPAAAALECIQE